jgi:uncharacterized membrane protein
VTSSLQPQLDDFAARLHALEVELAELRQRAAAEPSPEPVLKARKVLTRPELTRALQALEGGDVNAAVKQLERTRRRAVAYRDPVLLVEVLELAQRAEREASGRLKNAAGRLAYATEQNLKWLERAEGDVAAEPARVAAPPARAAGPPAPEPARPRREVRAPRFDASDLLGARALAIAGGCVTLLGIVFFFVLAVNRGWIGPSGRVALGAAAAAGVFIAGLELRRRYGETHSALAAVAAGIAGGYATLLAAAALYDMVPDSAALAVATAIAAAGVVTALRWRAQIVAGLGLIGAILVPVAVVAQGGLSTIGTAFVAVMLAATGVVAIRERWNQLLFVGMAASAPQIAALVFRPQYAGHAPTRIVALAAVFSLLYLAIGIGRHVRDSGAHLGQLVTGPITGAALLAGAAAARLYGTTADRGVALLVIACAYGLVATLFYSRRAGRDLSSLLAAVAFTVGAIGLSELLSGQPLAYAWAAEAAALAWLARRTREIRFQLWAGVYLLLALGHVLFIDAQATLVFLPGRHPAHGAAPVFAVAVAALVFGRYTQAWGEAEKPRLPFGIFAGQIESFAAAQAALRDAAFWVAGLLSTYGLSLVVFALFSSFDWGHVALAALWSAVGVGIVLVGLRRGSAPLRGGGLVWVGGAGTLAVLHAGHALASTPRSVTFLVVATALLLCALAYQLLEHRGRLAEITAAATVLSLALAWAALAMLLHGRAGGAVLLALAVLFGTLAALVFRRGTERDFSTLLWALAALVAAVAAAEVVAGTYLVLSWAVGGVSLAWLSVRAREPRLLVPAGVYVAAAIVHALALEAPPSDLFVAHANPATGVPALVIVAGAVAAGVRAVRGDTMLLRRLRGASWWIGGVLAVYAVSLSILELLQRAFPHASQHTDFQRGHTAVSAFWGLLGLALLYVGLTRWRSLRIAGFALFALSLAKIFLYDLPSLSSLTRALSFLAVGGVLLLGGFFYQRLTASHDDRGDFFPRAET